MRTKTWILAGTLWAALGGLAALAADPVKLGIKPGLWEISSENQFSGAPPVSDEQLARLTPDQRARMQALMQASMAEAAKPHLAKHCMTPEKIARGLDLDENKNTGCQRKILSNSGSELQMTETCPLNGGSTVLDEHFKTMGSDAIVGTVHVVRTEGGKTMTVNSTVHGQWLGPSCGDIKDFEIEQ